MSIFQGSATAMITPFTQDGINFDAFGKFIDFQIQNGTDAIVVCGTTGEPSTMTHDEKLAAIEFAVRHTDGRIPVIAGTGGNNTVDVITLSQQAQRLGVDALLIVTPYYNKTTQKGLIQHFRMIADNVDLPIIMYNVPARTGLNMLPATVAELAGHERIVAMKEASNDIQQVMEMQRLSGCELDMYSGSDEMILPIMAAGGKGVISVASNIAPQACHDLVAKFLAGDVDGARELQFKLSPLVAALFCETSPIPVKTAANLMGMQAGPLRMPLCEMEEVHVVQLKKAMADFGLTW